VFAIVASPFLMLAAPLALVVLGWGRHWVGSALAGILTVALVLVQLPSYFGETPRPGSVPVRVMTINMLFGQADPQSIAALAKDQADILLVQELTSDAAKALSAAGTDRDFPYHALDARPQAAGVGIYSRYPITDSTRIGGFRLALVSARVRVEGVAREATVASVHFAAPWPQPIDGWHSDFAAFPRTLADLAAQSGDGPTLIGGDFNATIDMRPFRELLTGGYRDASEQAGTGRQFTYPSNNRRIPPFMGIDHILTRNATAASTSTVEVPDSDHRALLATVMLPQA
jgi:endonuclease/exonuclease/phosphatase (EEP) superfamily protein YafD